MFFLKTCYGCGVKIDYSGTNVEADTVGAIRIKQVRNGDFWIDAGSVEGWDSHFISKVESQDFADVWVWYVRRGKAKMTPWFGENRHCYFYWEGRIILHI